jgi:hypothetical protein
MLRLFRAFVLRVAGVAPTPSQTVRVSLVSRKPYNRFIEHSFLARQVRLACSPED